MSCGVRCVILNLLIFFRLYEMIDKRFYGKFLAVMIQYLTFRTEKMVCMFHLCFPVERIRMCINTKALIAHNVEIVCLRLRRWSMPGWSRSIHAFAMCAKVCVVNM